MVAINAIIVRSVVFQRALVQIYTIFAVMGIVYFVLAGSLHKSYRLLERQLEIDVMNAKLYAPQTTLDETGRRVMVAWVRMPAVSPEGWRGMFSSPRVVEVVFPDGDGLHLVSQTPKIKDGWQIEALIDENLVEIFINDGEYVISNVAYDLKPTITSNVQKEIRLYTMEGN